MKRFSQTLAIAACVCVFSGVALGAHKKPKKQAPPKIETIIISQPKPGAPVDLTRTDLKNPTVIKHYFFSIQAPKGWSVVASGAQSDPHSVTDAVVSLTPTANTAKDSTYLSVRTVYGEQLPKTTADLFAVVSRDKSKQTRYVQLSGQQWIFSQFETKNPDGSLTKQYAVRTIVGTRGFLAMAGTPTAQAKTTGPELLKILNTIKVNR